MPWTWDLAACAGKAEELLPALVRLVSAEGWPHQPGEGFVGLRPELANLGRCTLTLSLVPPAAEGGQAGGILRVETTALRLPAPGPGELYERLCNWNAEHDNQDLLAVTSEQKGEVAVTVRAELVPQLGAKEPYLAADLRRAVERVARAGARLKQTLETDLRPPV